MNKTFRIIRPINLKPRPDKFEERVAEICAEYFESDIEFVVRANHTTPDLMVLKTRQFWEVKNIRSNSRHAIEDNLRKASKQSPRIIISLLRAGNADGCQTVSRVQHVLKTRRMPIRRVIVITKNGKVIDVK